MPTRTTKFTQGCYYHAYNRGIDHNSIFFKPENYLFLLKRLKTVMNRYQHKMAAYCLMPNHYHFFIYQKSDRVLSKTMQVVFNSYSKAVNKQQKRKGTLFERRFKAKLIDNDAYSIHLMRYIHKNPVEAKLTKTPESWTWSNYRDHQGLRTGTLLHWPSFKQYFKSPMNYKNFVENETIPKPDKFDQVCFD